MHLVRLDGEWRQLHVFADASPREVTAMTFKIVSGGQTGVDRAGLEAAIALGLPYGGWVPKGRIQKHATEFLCQLLSR